MFISKRKLDEIDKKVDVLKDQSQRILNKIKRDERAMKAEKAMSNLPEFIRDNINDFDGKKYTTTNACLGSDRDKDTINIRVQCNYKSLFFKIQKAIDDVSILESRKRKQAGLPPLMFNIIVTEFDAESIDSINERRINDAERK